MIFETDQPPAPAARDESVAGTLRPGVPEAWVRFVDALQHGVAELEAVRADGRRLRDQLRTEVEDLRFEVEREVAAPDLPRNVPVDLRNRMMQCLRTIRQGQQGLLRSIEDLSADFDHAEVNEDRFVVLAFGEVNSGKSALANHVAGLDFPEEARPTVGRCFVGDQPTARLEEKAVEATKEYQGFRLPGLLWIDCPGILSETFANARLAVRLVGRADLIVILSASDAPFKVSEMTELRRLIERSGNQTLEACVAVTKFDTFEDEENPDGTFRHRVVRKGHGDWARQRDWFAEQLHASGLDRYIRTPEPTPISVYLARQALGRSWKTGQQHRPLPERWADDYAASGLPEFLAQMERIVRERGAELKAAWPAKRRWALLREVERATGESLEALEKLSGTVVSMQARLADALAEARRDAAEGVASRVPDLLQHHGIRDPRYFERDTASRQLRKVVRDCVAQAVKARAEPVVREAARELGQAVKVYVDQLEFSLDVREVFRTMAYRSTARSRAVGRGVGGVTIGLGGAVLGAAAGSFFGPIGMVLGALLGGWLFGSAGSDIGEEIGELGGEEVTVRVPAGTNADEVIAETLGQARAAAITATEKAFQAIDGTLLAPLRQEAERLKNSVRSWTATFRNRLDSRSRHG